MKRSKGRIGGLLFIGMAAAIGTAQAAAIEFIKVQATIAGASGGGGNMYRYSSVNGLTTQGTALPPSTITQTASSNTNQLNQTSAWVMTEGYLVNGGHTNHAVGYAYGDLATGSIGVLGSSVLFAGSGSQGSGLGTGTAVIRDQLTFMNLTGAGVPIDVYFTLHGTQLLNTNGVVGESLRMCLGASCSLAGNTLLSNVFDYGYYHNSAFLPDGNYVTLPTTGWVSASFTPGNNPTDAVFHGVYMVAAGTSNADLYAHLTLDCRLSATCDYSHTASFDINLPAGVSFASASGAFLTAVPSGGQVPEPQAWILTVSGALALAIARRGKRAPRP